MGANKIEGERKISNNSKRGDTHKKEFTDKKSNQKTNNKEVNISKKFDTMCSRSKIKKDDTQINSKFEQMYVKNKSKINIKQENKWTNIENKDSNIILVNNVLNGLKPQDRRDHNGKNKQKSDNINPNAESEITEKKMDEWTNKFELMLKNSLGDFSKEQEKALKNIKNKIDDKIKEGMKKSEDDFYRELIMMLIYTQAFSKDLQGVGQASVVPVNQESYL